MSSTELPPPGGVPARLTAVDALRGAVIVLMTLDHTRDFFHTGAMTFAPEDLARTTPAIFLTRWVTHFCAPAFMFLAGVGAFLRLQRPGMTVGQLSRFLWTRGLWLVLLEVVVMRVAMNFTFAWRYPVLLLVLFALGASMIALAVVIHLPLRVVGAVSVAVIALHNTLDGFDARRLGDSAWLWNVLHQPGAFGVGDIVFVVGYPLVPWVAVMAGGFAFGSVFLRAPEERRRVLVRLGLALVIGFVVLRALNVYGDPSPWAAQASPDLSALSFLKATKYPPSLAFLLMTLGPALLALAWLDRRGIASRHWLVVLGRVPLFFYVAHFWVLHLLAAALDRIHYGSAASAWLFRPVPSMGGERDVFPPDYGHSLWVVYVVWAVVVIALLPVCRRVGELKKRRAGARPLARTDGTATA